VAGEVSHEAAQTPWTSVIAPPVLVIEGAGALVQFTHAGQIADLFGTRQELGQAEPLMRDRILGHARRLDCWRNLRSGQSAG
jgi:hypothetical protein